MNSFINTLRIYNLLFTIVAI